MKAYSSRQKYRRPRRKSKQTLTIAILVILIAVAGAGYILIHTRGPNTTIEPIYLHMPDLIEGRVNVVLGDKIVQTETAPLIRDGVVFLPLDFVQEHFDWSLFWEPDFNRFTYTSETQVVVMHPGETAALANLEPVTMPTPIHRTGDAVYLPQDFVTEKYHVRITYAAEHSIVLIDAMDESQIFATIAAEETALRFEPHIRSPLAQFVPQGADVMPLREEEDFTWVRLQNGLFGYVQTDDLGVERAVPPVPRPLPPEMPPKPPLQHPIVLLWDQPWNAAQAAGADRQLPVPGVNVLSPTWWSFDRYKLETDLDNIAEIVHIGSRAYVDAAHRNNKQVWPLIYDIVGWLDGVFLDPVICHAIIAYPENRDRVIRQLLDFVDLYNLDGVNIDFESVRDRNGWHFVQFLREMRPLFNQRGVWLSVDLKVPTYTPQYHRAEIAQSVDFVALMAYDEHGPWSHNPGPVASIGFVENGIAATIAAGVPPEKLLLGISVYPRIWRTWIDDEGEMQFTARADTTQAMLNQFNAQNVEWIWMEDVGAYYAEYTAWENGVEITYKTWWEGARSVEQRVNLALQYNLAGIAIWKRYLETPDMWDPIHAYIRAANPLN